MTSPRRPLTMTEACERLHIDRRSTLGPAIARGEITSRAELLTASH